MKNQRRRPKQRRVDLSSSDQEGAGVGSPVRCTVAYSFDQFPVSFLTGPSPHHARVLSPQRVETSESSYPGPHFQSPLQCTSRPQSTMPQTEGYRAQGTHLQPKTTRGPHTHSHLIQPTGMASNPPWAVKIPQSYMAPRRPIHPAYLTNYVFSTSPGLMHGKSRHLYDRATSPLCGIHEPAVKSCYCPEINPWESSNVGPLWYPPQDLFTGMSVSIDCAAVEVAIRPPCILSPDPMLSWQRWSRSIGVGVDRAALPPDTK
ncbi:hypothetical protein KIPB_008727 [Kipferlia bialata]|uniref:Uncharacterized protein n=1 Tax=Kipferlia bialata TaxID=797122 RepID=A0A9K3GK44_9EUKA|nr:hypothetical protein KIPB_008727 [Kipferlia bialata]|eukprot:g8727.t1